MPIKYSTVSQAESLWQLVDEYGYAAIIPREIRGSAISCKLQVFEHNAHDAFKKQFPSEKQRSLHISLNNDSPEVILGLFGHNEVSRDEQNRILEMLEDWDGLFFAIIIFPDSFYEIPEGEDWGYRKQILLLEKITQRGVIPVKHTDLVEDPDILSPYFDKIALIARMKRAEKQLTQFSNHIAEVLSGTALNSSASPYRNLLNTNLKSRLIYQDKHLKYLNESHIQKIMAEAQHLYNTDAGEISENAIVKHFSLEDVPNELRKFGLDVLIVVKAYKRLFEKIKSREDLRDIFFTQLRNLEELLELATNISLVGPFSSGKTTFINHLLGLKLKTSSAHNTAVLTTMKYLPKEQTPFLNFEYRPKYYFELFGINWNHSAIALESPCDGFVREVFTINNQSIIVLEDEVGAIIPLSLGKRYPLDKFLYANAQTKSGKIKVKKGELITKGVPRSEFSGVSKRDITTFGKAEISELIHQIELGSFSSILLVLHTDGKDASEHTGKGEVLHFLKLLLAACPDELGNVAIDMNTDGPLGIFHVYWLAEIYLTLAADHHLPRQHSLDKMALAQLSAKNQEEAYLLEKPACYLFAKNVQVNINEPILQIANITDTPGLGSVTVRHDSTTEEHLRETQGVIILMIKLDRNVERLEFWNLLSLLQCIFKHQNKSTDHIFFLCNYFKDLWGTSGLVEQKLTELKKYLAAAGFPGHELFVMDLRNPQEDEEAVKGYPSLGKFRTALERKTKELGSGQRLRTLTVKLRELINNEIALYQQQIDYLSKVQEQREKFIVSAQKQIKLIEAITLDTKIRKKEVEKFSDALDNCSSTLNYISAGNDWNSAKTTLVQMAENITSDFNAPDYFAHLKSKTSTIRTVGGDLPHKIPITISEYAFKSCGEVSTKSYQDRIDAAHAAWPSRLGRAWNWIKGENSSTLNNLRRNVSSFFSEELNRLKKSYNEQADKGEKEFYRNQKDAIQTIRDQINAGDNQNETVAELEEKIAFLSNEILPEIDKIESQIKTLLYHA